MICDCSENGSDARGAGGPVARTIDQKTDKGYVWANTDAGSLLNAYELTFSSPMKDNLHAILSEPEVYPVSLTLDCGSVITIPHGDFVHLAPRQKNLVFFPPDRKGESMEFIALEKVVRLSIRL